MVGGKMSTLEFAIYERQKIKYYKCLHCKTKVFKRHLFLDILNLSMKKKVFYFDFFFFYKWFN